MKKENFYIKNHFNKNQNKKKLKILSKRFLKEFLEVKKDINNPCETLNIFSNEFKFNFALKEFNKFKRFKKIAFIGMGGSILGAEAMYCFLKKKIKKEVYFFDNLEENKLSKFKKDNDLKKILFLIISKSGNTIETLSNMFSLNLLKKNSKNIIIISEKSNNTLFLISKNYNLFYIEHKKNVGGRYSVLSEVGIVPAFLMGIKIQKLRANIQNFLKEKKKTFLKKSVLKLTDLLIKKRTKNIIFLCYSEELEKFLFWCQQLIAESLGKKGKGFLPTVSVAPKDHHSLLQLYLDGPKDKLFYIFNVEKNSRDKILTNLPSKNMSFIKNKFLSDIKKAQKNALVKTLIKENIPFREFNIKEINEEVLGELFSYFILETVFIGKLAKIDPFDQPAVEQVKIFTKKLLS